MRGIAHPQVGILFAVYGQISQYADAQTLADIGLEDAGIPGRHGKLRFQSCALEGCDQR